MGAKHGQIPYTGNITLCHGGESPTGFLSQHSTHRMKPSFITSSLVSVLSLMVFCTACSTTPKTSLDDSPQQQMNSAEFEGLTSNTLPAGAKMINEQTLILGSGDSWVGKITLDVGKDAAIAYRFFLDQYPKQGWSLLSTVRGQNSMLVFTKEDRNATVLITEGNVVTSGRAVLTVTPRVTAPKP